VREIEKMTEDSNNVSNIGAKFVQTMSDFAPSFKLYVDYINNYSRAVETVRHELEKNKKFRIVLQKQSEMLISMNLRNADLESYLIIPAQLIPRYRLLLVEILKTFSPSDENYAKAEKAVKDLSHITDYCNEKRREFENAARMMEIIKELKLDDFVVPNRHFIRQEIGTDLHVIRGEKSFRCDLYLFNDVMIITTYELMLFRKQIIPLVAIDLMRESPNIILDTHESKIILECTNTDQETRIFDVLRTNLEKNERAVIPVVPATPDKKKEISPSIMDRVRSLGDLLEKAHFFKKSTREKRRIANEIATASNDVVPPLKQGYLELTSTKSRKVYFILKCDELEYFDNENKRKELGMFKLKDISVSDKTGTNNTFIIYDKRAEKTYYLQASNEDLCEAWSVAINKAIQHMAH
jgi:hypothetical protein